MSGSSTRLVVPIPGGRLAVAVHQGADPAIPVVVVLPAMGVPARFYGAFASALSGRGPTVAVVDLRGQGESTPKVARGVRFGYRELVEVDIPAVLAAVAERYPTRPVALLGHSLGGQLALLHAASSGWPSGGVVLVAAGSVWFRTFGPVLGIGRLAGSQLLAATAGLLGYWPGDRLGFGGRQPAAVMRDWARQCRTGRYALPDTVVDYEAELRKLHGRMLAVTVAGDQLAPPAAVAHLCGKVPAAQVSRWNYSEQEAGGPVDHFRWARRGDALAAYIAAWLSAPSAADRTVTSDPGATGDPATNNDAETGDWPAASEEVGG